MGNFAYYRCTLCGETLELSEKDTDKILAHILEYHLDLVLSLAKGMLEEEKYEEEE